MTQSLEQDDFKLTRDHVKCMMYYAGLYTKDQYNSIEYADHGFYVRSLFRLGLMETSVRSTGYRDDPVNPHGPFKPVFVITELGWEVIRECIKVEFPEKLR